MSHTAFQEQVPRNLGVDETISRSRASGSGWQSESVPAPRERLILRQQGGTIGEIGNKARGTNSVVVKVRWQVASFCPAPAPALGDHVPEQQSVKCLAQPTHATVNSSGAGAHAESGSRVCTASVRLVLVVAASKDGVARHKAWQPESGLGGSLGVPLSKLSFVAAGVGRHGRGGALDFEVRTWKRKGKRKGKGKGRHEQTAFLAAAIVVGEFRVSATTAFSDVKPQALRAYFRRPTCTVSVGVLEIAHSGIRRDEDVKRWQGAFPDPGLDASAVRTRHGHRRLPATQ
ncbi:hypothetical protein CPLU01_02869 [Colletotrichum plurivorum]|uniref:Uncharacterized protein n=1 Tax=Colletotrichum plurivorum TaxID=2175906 RepID=A0A8H6KUE0_9PEZI|nr:hypothetical protein CPLU01_02869 [Colletotrichum plurivorum]